MAIFTAIPNKTQSAVAMKRVLDYVTQDYKTMFYDEVNDCSYKLVSGQNCVPESAYSEFMTTKHRFNKAKGVFFKQYVQSFKPDCGATPQQIHQMGVEMAKAFDGFEVVIATHIDRDHWHNHIVVNSVNSETGLKIQINEKGLEQLRNKSDEICKKFGLEVLEPYKKPNQTTMNHREYRAALRGNSKKLQLMNAIDYAVINSRSKEKFIENMKRLGYGVKWIDRYKYITYTTPDGQRFRDSRLFGKNILKKIWRIYMDLNQLQQMNQIQTITDQTVNALTEPIQPKYLMLKPEQYNLLAEHISMTGNAIVRNTDLIAKLPTQDGLENLITNEVRYWMSNTQDSVQNGINSVKFSTEQQLKNQTNSMQKIFGAGLQELKTELQTATRTKVKWFLLGAILPTVLLILQLIWR